MGSGHSIGLRQRDVATMTSDYGLRSLRACIAYRVEDSKAMGWPALQQSWQADLELVEARMAELGISVEGPRRSGTCAMPPRWRARQAKEAA